MAVMPGVVVCGRHHLHVVVVTSRGSACSLLNFRLWLFPWDREILLRAAAVVSEAWSGPTGCWGRRSVSRCTGSYQTWSSPRHGAWSSSPDELVVAFLAVVPGQRLA